MSAFNRLLGTQGTQTAPAKRTGSAFNNLLQSQTTQTTQTRTQTQPRGPQVQPRGPQAPRFQAPLGGTQIAPNKFRTPSGSIWEYLPDGTKVVHLAAQFGGGAYIPGESGQRSEPKSQDALASKANFERDHIVPYALGGLSTRSNLRQIIAPENNKDNWEVNLINKVKSGEITAARARLEAITKKQEQISADQPAQSNWEKFGRFVDTAIGATKGLFSGKPKPSGMEFKVGENLTDQQKRTAQLTINRSTAIGQAEEYQRATTGDLMNIPKTLTGLVRAIPRGLVQITNPTSEIDPLTNPEMNSSPVVSKLNRLIYGLENLKGYSLQAAESEAQFKDKGFGKLSTPLAVITATGTASLDLAPLYAPLVRAVNQELAGIAARTGTKPIQLTFQDLQGITSGKITSGEKYDAFKSVGNDINLKQIPEITATQNSLLRRATNPIQEFFKEFKPEYSATNVPQVNPVQQYFLENGTPQKPQPNPVKEYFKPKTEIVPDRVMQTTNPKTGELNYYTIPAQKAKIIIDKVDNSGGILPRDKAGNEYHITAKTPERMEELGFTHKGLADESTIPEPFTLEKPAVKPKAVKGTLKPKPNRVVPVKEKPVVTPEIKTSKLAKGVEAKAVERGLTKGFGDLPEYAKVNKKAQAEAALRLLDENPEMALKIAKGKELPPEGLLPESVFTAVENRALEMGDTATLRELANSSLVSEATGMGQRISMLAERNPYSPTKGLKKIKERLVKKAGGEKKVKAKTKEITKTMKKETEKVNLSKEDQDWDKFLSEISC